MRVSSLHNSVRRRALACLLGLSLGGCSSAVDQVNIEIEPTLALLGGTILATQGSGLVALQTPAKPALPFRLQDILMPIPSAYAASCPALSHASSMCVDAVGNSPGPNLQVFYDNCQPSTMEGAGYWRSYMLITFPSDGACAAVKAAGFVGAGLAAVYNSTVTRKYGSIGDDQNNVRLTSVVGPIHEAVYVYSRFNSGWNIDKAGGVEVAFNGDGTTRTINIKGVHAFAASYNSNPLESDDFDLLAIASSEKVSWDHTINTVKSGDTLFTVGPQVVQSGANYGFGEQLDNPTASFDGDVVVINNTVQPGAVFRIQQNIAQGTAVAVVTEALVYDDPTCCWPSSGVIESRFDLSYPAPTTEDRLEFLGTSCGAVRYTTVQGESARDTLRHCF
jgi:hypothetical protein